MRLLSMGTMFAIIITLMGSAEAVPHPESSAPLGLEFLQHEDWTSKTVSRVAGNLIGADSLDEDAPSGGVSDGMHLSSVAQPKVAHKTESAAQQGLESQEQKAKDFMASFGRADGDATLNKFYNDDAEDEKSEEVKSFERTFAKKNKQEQYAHELSLIPDQKVDKEMAELKKETTDPNWRKEEKAAKEKKQAKKPAQPAEQVAVAKPAQTTQNVKASQKVSSAQTQAKLLKKLKAAPKATHTAAAEQAASADAVVPEHEAQQPSPLAMLDKAAHHTSVAVATAQQVKTAPSGIQAVVDTVVPTISDPLAQKAAAPAAPQPVPAQQPDVMAIHVSALPVAKKPLSAAVLKKRQDLKKSMKDGKTKKAVPKKKEPKVPKSAFKDLESITDSVENSKDEAEDIDAAEDDYGNGSTMSDSAFEKMLDDPEKADDAGADDDTEDGSSIRDFLSNEARALKKEGKKPQSTRAVIEREEQVRTAPVKVRELPENASEEETEQDMGKVKPLVESREHAKRQAEFDDHMAKHDPLHEELAKAKKEDAAQRAAAKTQGDSVVSDMINKLGGDDDDWD